MKKKSAANPPKRPSAASSRRANPSVLDSDPALPASSDAAPTAHFGKGAGSIPKSETVLPPDGKTKAEPTVSLQLPPEMVEQIAAERQRWLREKYTEIAVLAGGLAHEIKNPLSTLNLNLQLLAEDFQQQTDNERRALNKIAILREEVRRLQEILDDFLRFARITDLRYERTDLNEVVQELVDFYGPQAQVAGIVTRQHLIENLPVVLLDRQLFKQALLNLLLNAQNAMQNGGELILQTRRVETWVELDVIDTGVGIDAKLLPKIFTPFFSTRPNGSGLGLPTVKRIVEAHQGELTLQTEVGKGTKFTIRLPAAPELNSAEQLEQALLATAHNTAADPETDEFATTSPLTPSEGQTSQ